MSTVVIADKGTIPDWVRDFDSFRRWARSSEFPESGGISFIDGEIWVDFSMEQLFSHNRVKTAVTYAVMRLLSETRTGDYVGDRMLLSNVSAKLASEPDGLYYHWSTVQSGRLKLVESADEGCTELDGTPDMVMEIVSRTSVRKDTLVLPDSYWEAGIPEYWLIDARGPEPKFDILSHSPAGYVPTEATSAGVFSKVFNRSFRLVQSVDPLGHPEFCVECS
jgi:Uma2 family endonuclease